MTSAATRTEQLQIHLSVELPPAAASQLPRSGQLVLSWLTRAEAERWRQHGRPDPSTIIPFVTRAQAAAMETERLLEGTCRTLAWSGTEEVYPIAVFDHSRAFWSRVLDAASANLLGVAMEPARAGEARVTLRMPAPRPEPTAGPLPWEGPRFRHCRFKDDCGAEHRVCLCLPPSYHTSPGRRYPVAVLLPGLGGAEMVRFQDRLFVEAMDRLAERSGTEILLVGVDTRTPHGSAYITRRSSPWSRFLSRDLLTAVDAEFRTQTGAAHRWLAGQSTGAFNAISVALTHPGVFGTVIASAPDALDFEAWLLTPDGELREPWLAWMRLEEAVQGRGQMLSLAHSWSPTADGGYQWPADLASGRIRRQVMDLWLRNSPLRRLEEPAALAALRALAGRLFIGAAARDEFGVSEPTRLFSRRLDSLGIEHRLLVDEQGHFDAQARLARLLCHAGGDAKP